MRSGSTAGEIADVIAYLLTLEGSHSHDDIAPPSSAVRCARSCWHRRRVRTRRSRSDRLLRAADEPQNWLTYSGGYSSQRHSR